MIPTRASHMLSSPLLSPARYPKKKPLQIESILPPHNFLRGWGGDNILNLMLWFVSIIESNFIQKKSIWHSFIKLLDTASKSDVKILI